MPISPWTFSDVFCEFVFCVCSRTSCMVGSRWKLWPISGTRRSDRARLVLRTLTTRLSYSEPNTHAPECWWMGGKMKRVCVLDSECVWKDRRLQRGTLVEENHLFLLLPCVSPVCSWPLMTSFILCGLHHSAAPPPLLHTTTTPLHWSALFDLSQSEMHCRWCLTNRVKLGTGNHTLIFHYTM